MIRTALAITLATALATALLGPSTSRADIAPPRPAPVKPVPDKKHDEPKAEKKADDKADKKADPKAAPAGPQAPVPPAELQKLQFLAGTFNCDGTSPVKGSVDATYKGKWTSKLTLGNFFLGWQYAENKDKARPVTMTAEGRLSWDGGLKRFLLDWADSNGTATLLRAEAPADVDQYVFRGTATASFGRHVPHQFTITRTPKGFDLLLEGNDNDGQMARLALFSCAKGK